MYLGHELQGLAAPQVLLEKKNYIAIRFNHVRPIKHTDNHLLDA